MSAPPPFEEYLDKIEACLEKHAITIRTSEEFHGIEMSKECFTVFTRANSYKARRVVLAFGSNIPVDLGVYGEAKTMARRLENPEDHIGAPTLILGGWQRRSRYCLDPFQGQTRQLRFHAGLLGQPHGTIYDQQRRGP